MDQLIILFYTSVMCMNCTSYLDTVKRAVVTANVDNCCEIRVIDVTEDPPYQVRGITKIPSLILVDEMGEEITRKNGYTSVTKVVEWLQYNKPSKNY